MGGNFYKLGRVPRARYLEIEAELRAYLDSRFGRGLYRIPRYYGSKHDFGDVDILLSHKAMGGDWEGIKLEIVTSLGIERYESNGKIFSTVFRNFQVDFFPVPHELLEAKSNYMDFNDLGNLIGRLFRPFNLKYGESGLHYRHGSGGYKKEIPVSRNWKEIFDFVGLDYSKWALGFDDFTEMFDWVLESPYFRPEPYLDPTSPIVRRRAKQRTTMRNFLAYLEERQANDRRLHASPPTDREFYVTSIEDHFPQSNLGAKVREESRREAEQDSIRAKFNGKLVKEWLPGLEGKALGVFIRNFRVDITRDQLLAMSARDVEKEVRRRHGGCPGERYGAIQPCVQ